MKIKKSGVFTEPSYKAVPRGSERWFKRAFYFFLVSFVLASVMMGTSPLPAAFLDFSEPAREAAMGGNGVALPEGTSALMFNPAGLGDETFFRVSARYENLFAGIENDSLSTGNLSAILPVREGDAFGVAVDHFGSNELEQDRILAAFGKSFGEDSLLAHLRLGASLSFLREQFTLSAPLSGSPSSNVSAGDFSIGLGALYDPLPWMTLGFSAEDLNEPNVGVLGVDRVPALFRYGVAVRRSIGDDRLNVTLGQVLSAGNLETQGGVEWLFTYLNLALRAGGDANHGAVGLGFKLKDLALDYAYEFSWMEAPSLGGVGLPGSHLLEVSFSWGDSSRDEKVFQGLIFKGNKEVQQQNWKDAFWNFQQACLLKPNDPEALQGRKESLQKYNEKRAESYFQDGIQDEREGNFQEAQRDYAWASSLDPGEKRYSEARDRVKKSMAQGALGDPRVQKLLQKSLEWFKQGRKRAALRGVDQAQKLHPGDLFLEFMAKVFGKSSTGISARDRRSEQLAIEAEIYRSKGRMDLAQSAWKKILKIDPSNLIARENLTENSLLNSEDKLSAEDKVRSERFLEKGLNAYSDGEIEEAIRDWEEVLKIDPHNINAMNNLTRAKLESTEGDR